LLDKRGRIVPPGDAAAMAEALIDLAQDPASRETLGLKARTVAMQMAQDGILSQMETRLSRLVRAPAIPQLADVTF
jgi:colanic acid biosynthesis glycosyl transferase WcaI